MSHSINENRILFLRTGDFDSTPAIPRYLSVLTKLLNPKQIEIGCWRFFGHTKVQLESTAGVEIEWLNIHTSSRSWSRFPAMVSWWAFIAKKLLKGRYQIVQTSDVFCLVPVLSLKPMLGYKIVMDIRDPISSTTETRWGKTALLLSMVEDIGARKAEAVVIVDENRRKYLPDRIRESEKVLVVRNLPLQEFPAENLNFSPPANGQIIVNYSGYLNEIRGSKMLASLLRDDKETILHLVGESSDPTTLSELSKLNNTKSFGRVSHNESLAIMAQCHLVALIYDPFYRFNQDAAPNKMYEALMLGRPMLASDGTPMAVVCNQFDCGYVIPYGDNNALRHVINSVRTRPEEWVQKARNARDCYEREFRWENESHKVGNMYRRLIES